MKSRVITFGLALFSLTGCGTVSNLENDCSPYGGIAETMTAGKSRLEHIGEGKCIPPVYDYAAATYLFAIDLPLSAIGDTLTLPITIPIGIKRAD